MMHYTCYENWIQLYQTKRREIEQECALFCIQNQRGTSSLLENLREENWSQEYQRSWMENEIEMKQ